MSLENYAIIDSTLREGEQFINADFTREQKIRVAHALDEFGVEYLELTSPLASPGCAEDVRTIVAEKLNARILTHIRCHKDDAAVALDTGVNGLDMVIGTSSQLRQFSHGKNIDADHRHRGRGAHLDSHPGAEYRAALQHRGLLPQRGGRHAASLRGGRQAGRGEPAWALADTVGIAITDAGVRIVRMVRRRRPTATSSFTATTTPAAPSPTLLRAGRPARRTSTPPSSASASATASRRWAASSPACMPSTKTRRWSRSTAGHVAQPRPLVADMVGVDVPFNNYVTGTTRLHP